MCARDRQYFFQNAKQFIGKCFACEIRTPYLNQHTIRTKALSKGQGVAQHCCLRIQGVLAGCATAE
eukprot:scaffold27767_cov19-Tisochrysis_lutea.AAC.3